MRSIIKICLFGTLSLSLSFCGMLSKTEDAEEKDIPRYENYHSSGVYKDIEGETRSISSEDYSDDDYGDINNESAQDEGVLLGIDDPEPKDDPLPVEKIGEPQAVPIKKATKLPKFKNGMYRVAINCIMRAKASASSKEMGKVRKGKKLWMEAHNSSWVKVFKKSGPVYINRMCL